MSIATLPQWRTLADIAEPGGWQVRAADSDAWEVLSENEFEGRAVPYGRATELWPGFREEFVKGAFRRQVKDPARVQIAYRHDEIIGHCVRLEERDDGLWVRARVSASVDVPEARKAMALMREKIVDELSIGFSSVPGGTEVSTDGDVTTYRHTLSRLREVSVVPWGAYARWAKISAFRDADGGEHAAQEAAADTAAAEAAADALRVWREEQAARIAGW